MLSSIRTFLLAERGKNRCLLAPLASTKFGRRALLLAARTTFSAANFRSRGITEAARIAAFAHTVREAIYPILNCARKSAKRLVPLAGLEPIRPCGATDFEFGVCP